MSQSYKVFINNFLILITDSPKNKDNFESPDHFYVIESILDLLDYLEQNNYVLSNHVLCKSNDIVKEFLHFKSHFKCIIAAGGVVINKSNKYLFIFKNETWDLPKGKVELGEALDVAAQREVVEECGFNQLELDSFFGKTYHIYYEKKHVYFKETNWFLFKSDQSRDLCPQFEEGITDLKWVSEKKVLELLNHGHASIKELFLDFGNNTFRQKKC